MSKKFEITHISFRAPVPVKAGATLTYWSRSSDGKAYRIEESDRCFTLIHGTTNGGTWEPSGYRYRVPFENVASIAEAPSDVPPQTDDVPGSLRARSRA